MFAYVTPLLMLLILSSCAGDKGRFDQFRDQLQSYNEGLRWRSPEAAAKHLMPEEREQFLEERYEIDEDLRIGDYEVIRVKWEDDKEKARVRVRYSWHLDSYPVVKKTTTEQTWRRRGRGWLMVDEVTVRGDVMPGGPDPAIKNLRPEDSSSSSRSATDEFDLQTPKPVK